MKFLADMGISPQTITFLRSLQFDAFHLAEQQLYRLPDDQIIELAREQGRIILTHDLDFGTLMAASRAALPSVIIFRLANMTPAYVNHHLQLILAEHQAALIKGALLSVREGQVRVRLLPI